MEEIERKIEDIQGFPASDTLCPKCGGVLKIYPEGTSPDDFENMLICPKDFYFERE